MPEADAAVAAVACFNPDFRLIYKHTSYLDIKKGWQITILFCQLIYSIPLDYMNFSTLEANYAVCGGEQGKVSAYADILAGEKLASALAGKD